MESAKAYGSAEAVSWTLDSTDSIASAVRMLRPRTAVEPALHAGGTWAVRFPASPGVRLRLVGQGACWLRLDGYDWVHLQQGDCYFLCDPPAHVLASGQGEPPRDVAAVTSADHENIRIGAPADEDTYLCGGHFLIDDLNAALLFDILPPLVHVRAADPRTESLVQLGILLQAELRTSSDGGTLVTDNLAQILLIHMLRAHAETSDRPLGWLGALGDDGVGAALRAMHADVAHQWTLGELAATAHMSRSAFSATFREKIGAAPLTYLIRWRMSLARDALRHGQQTMSELAAATGYLSESAFSTAFRRVVGMSPRQFRGAAQR